MGDNKYKDREYLRQYDLDIDLFNKFDLKILDIIPVRKIYIIITDKGNKVLKKLNYGVEELKNIYDGIKYIKKSFPRVVDFVETKEGEIYCNWKGNMYCVMDLVEGRECEYSNPLDILIASRGIAELHKASEGFKPLLKEKIICGKTVELFEKKLEELNFFRRIALAYENKTEFDNIFLRNYDYYKNKAIQSINILKTCEINKLCTEKRKVALCHHDLANHNILINENEAYFIDFDYSIVDLKVHDLCNFINKAVKQYAYDIERAKDIIAEYEKINSIDSDELKILHGMLTFPEDFYSISKDFYVRRKLWSEVTFINRIEKKVGYKEEWEEFLFNFHQGIK